MLNSVDSNKNPCQVFCECLQRNLAQCCRSKVGQSGTETEENYAMKSQQELDSVKKELREIKKAEESTVSRQQHELNVLKEEMRGMKLSIFNLELSVEQVLECLQQQQEHQETHSTPNHSSPIHSDIMNSNLLKPGVLPKEWV